MPFQPAVKYGSKLRLAIQGPAGAGKTFTALKLAREMAPRVTINGLTAERALARHQHGPWCHEPYSAD